MNKILQVGVTGGIGAGKSLVCRIFGVLGIPVYDADSRARHLMENSPALRDQITAAFGSQSYLDSGLLNRSFLAENVFNDIVSVQRLNRLVHPEVARDYQAWVNGHAADHPYLIKEAALLIESGSYRQLDYLVTVLAPQELRIQRVLERDPQRTRSQVMAIISKQVSEQERIDRSHFQLNNDEKRLLVPQVLELHEKFIDSAG